MEKLLEGCFVSPITIEAFNKAKDGSRVSAAATV